MITREQLEVLRTKVADNSRKCLEAIDLVGDLLAAAEDPLEPMVAPTVGPVIVGPLQRAVKKTRRRGDAETPGGPGERGAMVAAMREEIPKLGKEFDRAQLEAALLRRLPEQLAGRGIYTVRANLKSMVERGELAEAGPGRFRVVKIKTDGGAWRRAGVKVTPSDKEKKWRELREEIKVPVNGQENAEEPNRK